MPKYDYRCNDCGVVYEKREGFDAPALQTCPECSGSARRVLSLPAIVFKGSGWYVTDSRKGSSGDDSSSPAAPSTTTKTDGSSSSKESANGSSSTKESGSGSSAKDGAASPKSESAAKT